MVEQRIKASDAALGIMNRRIDVAVRAMKVAKAEQDVAADVFAMFCYGNGLPEDTEFVRIDGNEIVVQVAESKASPPSP